MEKVHEYIDTQYIHFITLIVFNCIDRSPTYYDVIVL